MRKRRWWIGVAFAGLLLAVGLVVGTERRHEDTSAPRSTPTSRQLPTRSPAWPAAPRPNGALRIRGIVKDDHGPVAGVRVSASRPEPGQTLSELPCPPEVLARRPEPEQDVPDFEGCMEEDVAGTVELVQAREGEAPVYAEATTAEDGSFVLDGLPEGAFALWASDARGALLRTGVPAGTDGLELRLWEGLVLEGLVTDEDGRTPVPGALVTVLTLRHTRFFDARTGADGRFRVGPLPGVSFATVIVADGWLPSFRPHYRPPTPDTPVRLFRPRRLTGRVLSPGGAPVPEAEVRGESSLEGAGRWTQTVRTDASGRFTFTSLPPGAQTVSAWRDGQHALTRVRLADTPPPEVVLTLGEALFARGTVRNTGDSPVAGARVSVRLPGPSENHLRTLTGPDGRYALGPLLPGRLTFTVSAPGHLDLGSRERRVDADAGPLDFTLVRAVSVEGTVRDSRGQPLAGIELRLLSRDARGDVGDNLDHTRSDEDGRFVLDARVPGEGFLAINEEGFVPERLPVPVPSRNVAVALRRGASVTGTVLDTHGLPLGDVPVALWDAEDSAGAIRRAVADEDGHFTLRGVEAGRYVVEATLETASTERSASSAVALKEDEAAEVSLRLEEGRTLTGVVVDGEGHPLPDVHVRASLARESLPAWRRTTLGSHCVVPEGEPTGADGRFTLRGLAAGSHRLFARKEGYNLDPERSQGGQPAGGALSVDAKATEVRLVMTRLGRIFGRVVGPDGAPLTTFWVNGQEQKDLDGVFAFPFMRSGTWPLDLAAPGLAPVNRDVETREGIDVDLGTVRLEAGRPVSGRVLDAETSTPVMGARVELFPLSDDIPDNARSIGDLLETDEDGAFTFPSVARRPYTLRVVAEGLLDGFMTVAPEAKEVTVRMEAGARVEVTVSDARGRPQDAEVTFTTDWLGQTFDAPDGTAVARGLAAGEYTVEVRPRAEPPLPIFPTQRVRVPARGRLAVHLTARSGGTTVVLRADDSADAVLLLPGDIPAPAKLENLWMLYPAQHPSDGTTESAIHLTFRNVPPGRCTVFALTNGPDFRIHREVLDVPADGTVTRDVHPVWQPLSSGE